MRHVDDAWHCRMWFLNQQQRRWRSCLFCRRSATQLVLRRRLCRCWKSLRSCFTNSLLSSLQCEMAQLHGSVVMTVDSYMADQSSLVASRIKLLQCCRLAHMRLWMMHGTMLIGIFFNGAHNCLLTCLCVCVCSTHSHTSNCLIQPLAAIYQ